MNLTIAAFAAEQLIHETSEMNVMFILTQFGPIVQITESTKGTSLR